MGTTFSGECRTRDDRLGPLRGALAEITAADFATPGVVFQIGVAPRRVDILTAIDAVGFEEAWVARLEIEIEGLRIHVLGREHLLRNKRASGRPKDLADASWLEARGMGP